MLATAAYLLLAYLAASWWESSLHRSVLHASRHSRRAWRRWGGVGGLMRLAYFYHHTVHHRRTFRHSHFIQFDNAAQKLALDARLKGALGNRVRSDRYGLTVTGPCQILVFAGVPVLLSTVAAGVLAPHALWAGVAISVAPLLLSRYVHPLLHVAPAGGRTPALLGLLRRTPVFGYLQRYHLLHHRHGSVNFNLLPGADWLLARRKQDEPGAQPARLP